MVSSRIRRIILALTVGLGAFVGLASASPHVRADDEAMKIYELARRLHDEDTKLGGFTVWVNGDIGEDTSARRVGVNGGDPIPAVKFNKFDGGGTMQPQDLKGPYILNFWASWCRPCREEFPRFAKRIGDKSLSVPVIFVNVLDFKAAAGTFLSALDAEPNLTVVVDPQASLYFKMGFSVLPYTVLVDAGGNIQAIQIGEISELGLEFFGEIATHPAIGSFDRLHPDVQAAGTAAPL